MQGHRVVKHIVWTVVAAVVVASPELASAQDAPATDVAPDVASTNDKPLAVEAGLGVTIGVANRNNAAFQLMEGISWHPGIGGDRHDEGLHFGGELGESFGDGFVGLRFAARVGYDIGIDLHSTDLRLVVDPYTSVGLGVVFPNGTDAQAAFDLGVGAEVKLDVGDQWFVMLRPIHFEFFIRDQTAVAYEVLAGAGLRF